MRISAIAILSTLIVLPSSLIAQAAPAVNTGRITHSVGRVSIQPGGKGDWIKASPGLELSVGDNLWADMNAEVEIRADETIVMVGPETSMSFDQINDSNIKVNLRLGSVIVQIPPTDEFKHCEIGTPNLRFTLNESGDYRIDVNGEGNETDITAKQGHGLAIIDGTPYKVVAGQQVRFKTREHLEVEVGEIPEPDSFDLWASNHDQSDHDDEEVADVRADPALTESASRRVWESNGDAGHWVYIEDIGPAWVPTHWSELIILPTPSVGVVLDEEPPSQERSVSFSRQNAVMKGTLPPMVYSPVTQSVSPEPAQAPMHRNTARSTPARGYAGTTSMPSVSRNHDAPQPQISVPTRMEPPHISPPKPVTTTPDKPKK
jgi:hypothetical protein